ncbi:MAG: 50S ribosomal protein L27 [Lentisphaerae bacterium]|nr:50S ribosomal protein L27 [Lentisphaerota bacterium]
MARKKGSGVAKNGRDSNSKRLGVKCFDGEQVNSGSILVRQRGTRIHPGENVMIGRDDTLFSVVQGIVKYEKDGKRVRVDAIQPAQA